MRTAIERVRPAGGHGERAFVHFELLGLPDLELLGRLQYTAAQEPLHVHSHPGAFEICYLERGTQVYMVGGREYELSGGDLFVTFPDELHSTGTHPEEKSVLYWMIVNASGGRKGFLGLGDEGTRLLEDLRAINRRRFRANPEVKSHLDAIFAIADGGGYLRRQRIAHHVVEFLLLVVESAKTAGGTVSAGVLSEPIANVTAHINENIADDIQLTTLAEMSGLSLSHFKRRFRRELGMPPRQFILRAKIEAARRMLCAPGATVTGTAFRLGFSSSQYFATVYRRFVGRSPSEDRPSRR